MTIVYRVVCKILLYIGLIFWSIVFPLIGWYENNQIIYATSDASISNIWNIDVMNLPKLDNYVVDFSNTLDSSQLTSLNQKASDYDTSTSNEFAVVLIPDRQGRELYDIALSIFRNNEIGKSTDDNWLLLVVSPSEKKLRVMVWYGLEWDLPDVLVNQVIETDLRPYLNSWDLVSMVNNYYDVFAKILVDNDYKAKYMVTNATDDILNTNLIAIFMIFFFVWLFSSFFIPKISELSEEKNISKVQDIISTIALVLMWVIFLSILIQIFAISVWAIWYVIWAVFWLISASGSWSSSSWWWSSSSYWWWGFGGWWWFGWFGWWSTWWGGAGD